MITTIDLSDYNKVDNLDSLLNIDMGKKYNCNLTHDTLHDFFTNYESDTVGDTPRYLGHLIETHIKAIYEPPKQIGYDIQYITSNDKYPWE